MCLCKRLHDGQRFTACLAVCFQLCLCILKETVRKHQLQRLRQLTAKRQTIKGQRGHSAEWLLFGLCFCMTVRAHTHKRRNILPSFSRPALAPYVLGPASAPALINWPFHLVDVHCVSVFLCSWTTVCVCVCVWVRCLSLEVFGTLTEGCHSLWKCVIGASSVWINTLPYTSEKM